jgi:molecular chaperone DnaK (HSP70)
MPIALDFGTCNTVLARWNEASGRAELLRLGELTRTYRYRLEGKARDYEAPVVPSLIHYGPDGQRLLGEQVTAEGLADHPSTFLWAKLDVLSNLTAARRVGDVRVSPPEAAAEIVRSVLGYALAESGDLRDEELVVTVPVEAYNHYIQWLEEAVQGAFRGRVSFIDEATACILGYLDAVRPGDICMVFDFGGGTLDVSVVKADPKAEGPQKCRVLGRAGEELGGSLVDKWLLEALRETEGLGEEDVRQVGTRLLVAIEEAKIALSSGQEEADVTQLNDVTGRLISHTFTQRELREILKRKEFLRRVGGVVRRALEAARDKGVKESDLRGVFMVGGTSLLLGVRECVEQMLPDAQVWLGDPFGSIAAGACRLMGHQIEAATVHDYGLQFWDRERKAFAFEPMVPKGTPFPTNGVLTARYVGTAYDDAKELNLVVYERSEVTRAANTDIRIGADGRLQAVREGAAQKGESVRPLNEWAQDFIRPDPPCRREEPKRFVVAVGLDAQQRCLVWVKDTRPGNRSMAAMPDGRLVPLPLEAYPLVKLGRRGGK